MLPRSWAKPPPELDCFLQFDLSRLQFLGQLVAVEPLGGGAVTANVFLAPVLQQVNRRPCGPVAPRGGGGSLQVLLKGGPGEVQELILSHGGDGQKGVAAHTQPHRHVDGAAAPELVGDIPSLDQVEDLTVVGLVEIAHEAVAVAV